MIAKLHLPAFPLSQFIESFFYYTGFNPEHDIDRLLPDGNVQIIFDLTDYPKYIYDNETLTEIQACRKVWFAGIRTEPITIPSGRDSEMLVVNFHKGKAFPFLTVPMYSLTNLVVDGELVLKKEILELREKIQHLLLPEQKCLLLERELLLLYQKNLAENPCVEYVTSTIISSPNQLSIKEISTKVGYSQKHLITLFKKHVGISPKEFLKVIRFQQAIQQIELQQSVDWASIAFDCGFYDQSHFISNFREFSGYTPEQYLKLRGEHLNYLPVRE